MSTKQQAKGGKKTRKYGRSKRKALNKDRAMSLYVRGKITFEQYLKKSTK